MALRSLSRSQSLEDGRHMNGRGVDHGHAVDVRLGQQQR